MLDEERIFEDRKSAGIRLANLLEPDYKDRDVLVLGIPRGGIVVANEVAKQLHGELSTVITKRLRHPREVDLAIGAVAEDGSTHLTYEAKNLSERVLKRIIAEQEKDIPQIIKRYRNGEELPPIKDRTVIIVDDGIATGSTLIAAIKLCMVHQAEKIVVAVPVAGKVHIPLIKALADDIVIAYQPEFFYAIGQVYQDFHNLSDQEVIKILKNFERHPIPEEKNIEV